MASLPPRPASQRRSSPRDQGSSADARHDSESFSAASVDSETLFLNSTHASKSQSQAQPAPAPPHNEDDDPRKCWICFNDETEDMPGASEWRNPCPCALVAHEDCLLDWVASQEAPNVRRQAGRGSKITCPQCKHEIHLKRPRSLVVDSVRAMERLSGIFILPGTVGVLGYTVYQACFMHGVSTVYALFGLEDGYRILQPLHEAPSMARGRAYESVALAAVSRFFQHARLHFGLSAIPPILVASRVSIADSILPILPVIFLASSSGSDQMLGLGHWPPSAALSFSLLPYIRGAYNTYMEKVWGERQRRWLKEVQPRAGEADAEAGEGGGAGGAAGAGDDDALNMEDDGDDIFDIHVNFDIMDDLADHLPGGWAPRGRAHPLDAPPLPDDHVNAHVREHLHDHDHDHAHAAPAPDPPRAQQPQPERRNLVFQTTNVADTVLGALVFPYIAAGVGELLKLSLPKAWVTAPAGGARATGLLQSRWARSLLGGCLFVAAKDAVLLYVKWKMARNHRKRRVLDWDKKRGVVVDNTRGL
ncbi:uncharacterized protein K452DRAFT_280811 [Aplosporella prunicola CBS 121167]|uniref:RING-CH-type domain-containing protein n=1 Tax=Aplosporella prunicola CBS 121167 TaxID=1176127 RepID=A0A6A6AV58_9PEZI|nr:uncharacterized protein K452DRAFT_280811 [Aplosporella prunicola CBS 121167]KAF2135922.1 hypothetical protein K452DRAFT_280811 [Aplosporella prunicola CBS 121167]